MYRPWIPLVMVALAAPAHAQLSSQPATAPPGLLTDAGSGAAEGSGPLTLAAALALAERANPQLASARHALAAFEGTLLQAGASPNPVLALGLEDARRSSRETTVQLSQPIELGGKRQRRIEAAERGRDVASADLRASQAALRAGVTLAFGELLTAQANVQLAQQAFDIATRISTTVARRVEAGKVSPVEATRARVAAARVRLDALKASSELLRARAALAGFWGNLAPRFALAVGDEAQLPPLPDLHALTAALDAAPALARARAELARRQALARLEHSRRTPDLTVTLGVKRLAEPGVNQALFGLSMPLPLFDRNQGNLLEALRRTDQAGDELLLAQMDSQQALGLAYQQLRDARLAAQTLASDILPGARSAYEAALKGFEFGKFAYLEVLDAQRTLIEAQAEQLRAVGEARRAAAQLERLVGATTPPTFP